MEESSMTIKEAIGRRIMELSSQYDLSINGLANRAGIPPSTIYSMLNEKSKNPGVVTIQKICDGLEISVREFFNSALFEKIDPVVQ
jgi:transcriptional regulator with XRE-family HTH domain